jgi:hypothetical protein
MKHVRVHILSFSRHRHEHLASHQLRARKSQFSSRDRQSQLNYTYDRPPRRKLTPLFEGIEELLSVTNDANRGIEDETRMTRDYVNVAQLWETFKSCAEKEESILDHEGQAELVGLPGTGGHVPGRME